MFICRQTQWVQSFIKSWNHSRSFRIVHFFTLKCPKSLTCFICFVLFCFSSIIFFSISFSKPKKKKTTTTRSNWEYYFFWHFGYGFISRLITSHCIRVVVSLRLRHRFQVNIHHQLLLMNIIFNNRYVRPIHRFIYMMKNIFRFWSILFITSSIHPSTHPHTQTHIYIQYIHFDYRQNYR